MTFPAPGVYFPKVTLYYGNGQVYTQTFGVLVRDAASMNTMFMGMLSDFKAALGAANKTAAMPLLSSSMQGRIGPVVEALKTRMPQILSTFIGFARVTIAQDIATYAAVRKMGSSGRVFFVDFMRDNDGVWRIDSM